MKLGLFALYGFAKVNIANNKDGRRQREVRERDCEPQPPLSILRIPLSHWHTLLVFGMR